MISGSVAISTKKQSNSEIKLDDLLSAKRSLGFLQGHQESSSETSPKKELPSPQAF